MFSIGRDVLIPGVTDAPLYLLAPETLDRALHVRPGARAYTLAWRVGGRVLEIISIFPGGFVSPLHHLADSAPCRLLLKVFPSLAFCPPSEGELEPLVCVDVLTRAVTLVNATWFWQDGPKLAEVLMGSSRVTTVSVYCPSCEYVWDDLPGEWLTCPECAEEFEVDSEGYPLPSQTEPHEDELDDTEEDWTPSALIQVQCPLCGEVWGEAEEEVDEFVDCPYCDLTIRIDGVGVPCFLPIDWDSRMTNTLLELAEHGGLGANPFRILQLPVEAAERDIGRRRQHIEMAERLRMPADPGPFPYFAEPVAGLEQVQRALGALRVPETALVMQFSWFWTLEPHQLDYGMMNLLSAKHEWARSLWESQAGLLGHGPIAAHNLVILDLLELEGGEPEQFAKSRVLSTLAQTLGRPDVWGRVREFVVARKDPRLTVAIVGDLYRDFPVVFLVMYISAALKAAKQSDWATAMRLITLVLQAGFHREDVSRCFKRDLASVRDSLEVLRVRASASTWRSKNSADALPTVMEGKRWIDWIAQILPLDDPDRQALQDQLVSGLHKVLSTCQADADALVGALEVLVPLAAGETLRERLDEELAEARQRAWVQNMETKLASLEASDRPLAAKMRGVMRIAKELHAHMEELSDSAGHEALADEIARAILTLVSDLEEEGQYDLIIKGLGVAHEICSDSELWLELSEVRSTFSDEAIRLRRTLDTVLQRREGVCDTLLALRPHVRSHIEHLALLASEDEVEATRKVVKGVLERLAFQAVQDDGDFGALLAVWQFGREIGLDEDWVDDLDAALYNVDGYLELRSIAYNLDTEHSLAEWPEVLESVYATYCDLEEEYKEREPGVVQAAAQLIDSKVGWVVGALPDTSESAHVTVRALTVLQGCCTDPTVLAVITEKLERNQGQADALSMYHQIFTVVNSADAHETKIALLQELNGKVLGLRGRNEVLGDKVADSLAEALLGLAKEAVHEPGLREPARLALSAALELTRNPRLIDRIRIEWLKLKVHWPWK